MGMMVTAPIDLATVSMGMMVTALIVPETVLMESTVIVHIGLEIVSITRASIGSVSEERKVIPCQSRLCHHSGSRIAHI
jgi:hypothetical protein